MKNIKTPQDILHFMDEIDYGYIDLSGNKHINTLKGFRNQYRTMTIEDILKYKIGTCIEQVLLMHYLLDNLGIKNKMYCTRVYESGFVADDQDEHMHCFVLYFDSDGVHQIEHPDGTRKGIYHFKTEDEAIEKINKIYIDMAGGIARPITEYREVPSRITFKEFNDFINSLDEQNRKEELKFVLLEDKEKNYQKIHNWCQNKFVYEWFEQRKLSYEEIVQKYQTKLKKSNQQIFLINYKGIDIGLIQIYPYNNEILIEKYKNIYEYDLFIGEKEYLSKGIGSKIINKINNILFDEYEADCIVLRPFKRNIRAINCYLKNGFVQIKEYDGEDTLNNLEKYCLLIYSK